jgi:hypothetical protein
VLTAYVDESGQEQDNWMFVAGFVGNDKHWSDTADAWRVAIAPRKRLHMTTLRFKKDREKRMLERAGVVPEVCGLTPIFGGVRQSDYRDLIAGPREEKLMNGYICCCFAMVINTLRGIPPNERLEVVFERQDRYWWMTEIAMSVIASDRTSKDMLLPDGTPKLASWKSVPKDSTPLTQPADYFAHALLQVWRDKHSIKAQWCKPILDANGGEGLGAIMRRPLIRHIIQQGQMFALFENAKRMLGEIRGKRTLRIREV